MPSLSSSLELALMIEDGKLVWSAEQRARLASWCGKHDGEKVVVRVGGRLWQEYWDYLDTLAKVTGHTPHDLHQIFEAKFWPKRFAFFGSEEFVTTLEAREVNFDNYFSAVKKFVDSVGLVVSST